jgi:hypothetical protein
VLAGDVPRRQHWLSQPTPLRLALSGSCLARRLHLRAVQAVHWELSGATPSELHRELGRAHVRDDHRDRGWAKSVGPRSPFSMRSFAAGREAFGALTNVPGTGYYILHPTTLDVVLCRSPDKRYSPLPCCPRRTGSRCSRALRQKLRPSFRCFPPRPGVGVEKACYLAASGLGELSAAGALVVHARAWSRSTLPRLRKCRSRWLLRPRFQEWFACAGRRRPQ